jgi:nitroreductase
VTTPPVAPRIPDAPVDPQFLDRCSLRSFTDEPVTDEELRSLFEAARWAPSSGNEQPWVYLYATSTEDHARFHRGDPSVLTENNRAREFPNSRQPTSAFAFPGVMPEEHR